MPIRTRPNGPAAARGKWSTARWVTLVPTVLAALWFLLIGGHALASGRHFGPLGGAYWAEALSDAGIGTRVVGGALAVWGLGWCAAGYALLTGRRWLWPVALTLGFFSLWQEPVGTFLGLYLLGALALYKGELRAPSRRHDAMPRRSVPRKARPGKRPRGQALRRR